MATEYRLTLGGQTSKEDVAERVVADIAERPRPTASGQVLSADLDERRALGLDITSGRATYLEADSDNGTWEWEPETSVDIHFRLDNERFEVGQRNMLELVSNLLTSGSEDAALILDGNYLILTRVAGTVHKHRRSTWWDHYPYADEIIPG